MIFFLSFFFFFKQKTAYEMRISDWSSDVCLPIFHTGEAYPNLSLRADDHADPLAELRRLYRVSQGRYAAFMSFLPTRDNPCGVFDRTVIEIGRASCRERVCQYV